jgi:hypothetical protein
MIRKVDFVRGMGVTAVRHVKDGLEVMWLRHFGRGFKVLTFGVTGERLARIVGSHCFKGDRRVPRHGSRLLVLVIEKEPEVRRPISFKDGDFNEAVSASQCGRPCAFACSSMDGYRARLTELTWLTRATVRLPNSGCIS